MSSNIAVDSNMMTVSLSLIKKANPFLLNEFALYEMGQLISLKPI